MKTLTALLGMYTSTKLAVHQWFYVPVSTNSKISIKIISFSSTEQTTDETRIPENFILMLFLATKIGKCVNDDTKYQVEYDDDDDEEEYQIIDNACKEQRFLRHTT